MTRGMGAFIFMTSVIVAFSVLTGLGVPQALGLHYGASYDDDVQAVVDDIGGDQQASNTGSSAFTDFTVGAGRTLSAGWHIITNTDAVVILLTGAPREIADALEWMFRIFYGAMFAQFVRGVVIE